MIALHGESTARSAFDHGRVAGTGEYVRGFLADLPGHGARSSSLANTISIWGNNRSKKGMFVLDNVPRGQVQADFGSALMRKFDRMFDEAMVLYQIALYKYIVHLVGHDTLQLFGFEQGSCAEVGREGGVGLPPR